MKYFLKVFILVTIITGLFITGCTPTVQTTTQAATAGDLPTDESTSSANTGKLVVYAPASTSSIPVILAASKLKNIELTLYTNQSQANTLFLRGDVSILVTGLSVGVDLFKNGAPVQLANSFVSGLSYLVTYGKQVNDWADLKGQQIYLPFAGSPIEEATTYLAQQAGLKYGVDLRPVYSPFDSSVQLLKEGKAAAVVLPEPNVTLVEGQPDVFISLSYFDEWNKATGSDQGYPQVGSFVNSGWASSHAADIETFNQVLGEAISSVENDPAAAVKSVSSYYKLSPDLLLKSLNRTRYNLMVGQEMEDAISNYYQVIGKPLDEKFTDFYFLPAQ